MLITMFTDISLCASTGRGSFAVWAKANGATLRHAALFKEPVADSNRAEAQAIVSGTFVVIKQITPPPGSRIIAQTDSLGAIGILSDRTRNPYPAIRQAQEGLLATSGIEIEYRHVKGHRGHRTPRNAVNTWCDRECRRLLRAHRATFAETASAPD